MVVQQDDSSDRQDDNGDRQDDSCDLRRDDSGDSSVAQSIQPARPLRT